MKAIVLFVTCLYSCYTYVNCQEWFDCPLFTFPAEMTTQSKVSKDKKGEDVVQFFQKRKPHPFGVKPPSILVKERFMAKCAVLKAPLDYNNPNSNSKINVFIKKFEAKQPSTKSLWILQGGPGGSFAPGNEILMDMLQKELPDVDLFTLEHRGVGFSNRMGCVSNLAETPGSIGGVEILDQELPDCISELKANPDIQSFMTSDNAARDLNLSIETTRGNKEIFVYGISYGTMWLQRYLRLFPDRIKGAILDGIVTQQGPPGVRLTFDQWDKNYDQVGQEYLQRCAKDSYCRRKLTPDPISFVSTLYQKLFPSNGSSTCPYVTNQLDKDSLRSYIGSNLADLDLRHLIPALFYRLDRCADEDQQVFDNYFITIAQYYAYNPLCMVGPDSTMLQNNIGAAELWDYDRTYEQLEKEHNETLIVNPLSLPFYSIVNEYQFPRYTLDNFTFNATFSASNTSVLLMNGDIDPQTPIKYANATFMALQKSVRNVTFVIFPGSPHGTSYFSPDGTSTPCGIKVIASFVNSDSLSVNTSCIDYLNPVTFNGTDSINLKFLGVTDAYDGFISSTPSSSSSSSSSSNGYSKTLFYIVVAVLGVFCLIAFFFIVYFIRTKKDYDSITDK